MAHVTVRLHFLRQATRKVRLVTDLIRGRAADLAINQLAFLPKRAALPVAKLLKSGVAAAKERGLGDDLWISQVLTDQGPALKRRLINSRGRSSQLKKFTTHIVLTLSDVKQKTRNPKHQIRNKSK